MNLAIAVLFFPSIARKRFTKTFAALVTQLQYFTNFAKAAAVMGSFIEP
jgi:hypothetical protein